MKTPSFPTLAPGEEDEEKLALRHFFFGRPDSEAQVNGSADAKV
eukprot:CAMPEP_0170497380 /NCGR_PEP_ID=MMETSP0208-20121228/24629_1 /TAXON_ID=197538 /ORGANISM="Strombidium inclinatum, Strain S3" /LENGTH=43 /DNA_ID= /DNA_START= /DNA_END= /DNA_ORIENTATION=